MAKDHPALVKKALGLRKAGNNLITLLGGRESHPISVRVGGFYKVPTRQELAAIEEEYKWGLEAALEVTRVTGTLPFPDFERDYTFVALRHPNEYPYNEGRVVSNSGIDISVRDYDDTFEEQQVPYSTALKSVIHGQGEYLVGPLARYNLNYDRLTPLCKEVAAEAGLTDKERNPFKSIIIRSVETVYAFEEALRIMSEYEPPEKPFIDIEPKAGTGYGCTEAPRGILYHRYEVDSDGAIVEANLIPPTAQNQLCMESDLRYFVTRNLSLSDEELTWKCEQVIRNYDPCISCSTHFLDLHIDRE